MTERIDPIKYADNIREAWQQDDKMAVDKIIEKYGDQPVVLKDLEEMFSYSLNLLMRAYIDKDVIDDTKFNLLLEVLISNGIISKEEEQQLRTEVEKLEKKIEGEG